MREMGNEMNIALYTLFERPKLDKRRVAFKDLDGEEQQLLMDLIHEKVKVITIPEVMKEIGINKYRSKRLMNGLCDKGFVGRRFESRRIDSSNYHKNVLVYDIYNIEK